MRILERNYKAIRSQLMELVSAHRDILADMHNIDVMGEEQLIEALNEIYQQAADKHNHEREAYAQLLDEQMFGRIMNDIQSYDYLENEKYSRIQRLLKILQETFGYDEMMADQINAHRHKEDPDKTFENQRMDSRETGRDQDVELIQSAVYGDGKVGS